ncbi:anti-sigma factor FoxR [Pseudomonas sp. 3A(2025)]
MADTLPFPDRVLDQAILWHVRLTSGEVSPEQAERCLAWRRADASHEAAWQALQGSERLFAPLPAAQAHAAVKALTEVGASRRQAMKLLGLGLGVGGAGWLGWQQPVVSAWRADYATGTGQQRSITLADGSRLQLNTDTAVNVRFSAQRRDIELMRGEMFIHTGKDPLRPLRVAAAQASLRAIGTAFSVREMPETTLLCVTEGEVAIEQGGAESRVLAGQNVAISRSGSQQPTQVGLDPYAWAQGAISARRARLGTLIAEFARYRHGWLACDPAVAQLEVSGVFQINDLERALDTLAGRLPIHIQRFTPWWARIVARQA